MQKTIKLSLSAGVIGIMVAALAFIAALAQTQLAAANHEPGHAAILSQDESSDQEEKDEDETKKEDTEEPAKEEPEETESEEDSKPAGTYDYVAQPGDSYSLMARKAVQTYGIEEDVKLSGAQIIFAESKLTQAAGAGLLNVGQEVSIEKSAVSGVVNAATELSEAEEAAWNYYVQFVDFNTDNVGEAS